MAITSFSGKYDFLSNFYLCPVWYKGHWWQSVEHAYQAAKCVNPDHVEYFLRETTTAGQAKRRGQAVRIRDDWDTTFSGQKMAVKYQVMTQLTLMKYCDKDLRQRLRDTGDELLVEGNRWHDNNFGDCYCASCGHIEGKNMLGKILMAARDFYNHPASV